MYNTVVMCTVGVTVSMAVKGSASTIYAFQSICILFCATVTLLLIFVPKVMSFCQPFCPSDPCSLSNFLLRGLNKLQGKM